MRVVHVSYSYNSQVKTEEELLEQHYTVTGWAEALSKKGVDVVVVSRFYRNSELTVNNVKYYFVKDRLPPILRTRHLPLQLFKKIKSLQADIVHLHHLTLSFQTLMLRRILGKRVAIVVQHHGGVMPRRRSRKIHNLFNRVADAFFFTTIKQGKEWFMDDKLAGKVLPVMEGATFFDFQSRDAHRTSNYMSREDARKITKMKGSPVFLWVGRLDSNKDPMTVLDGFEVMLVAQKDAYLYMIYNDDRLANRVKKRIDSSHILQQRVQLLGSIHHSVIGQYYNSADYFILGSHYEGSGYALSEALRCGCVPIVTDIPSFRMMTDEGRFGALWQPGNRDSLVETAGAAINKPLKDEAVRCINFYEEKLSFDAIAGIALWHYEHLIHSKAQYKK